MQKAVVAPVSGAEHKIVGQPHRLPLSASSALRVSHPQGSKSLGFGCALLVRLDFTNDVQKVLDVHLQGHTLDEFLSGDAGSRNVLHSRGNLD